MSSLCRGIPTFTSVTSAIWTPSSLTPTHTHPHPHTNTYPHPQTPKNTLTHTHLLPPHAVEVCNGVTNGIHSDVAHVQVTRRVGEHGEGIELVFARTKAIVYRCSGCHSLPMCLPFWFNPSRIVLVFLQSQFQMDVPISNGTSIDTDIHEPTTSVEVDLPRPAQKRALETAALLLDVLHHVCSIKFTMLHTRGYNIWGRPCN